MYLVFCMKMFDLKSILCLNRLTILKDMGNEVRIHEIFYSEKFNYHRMHQPLTGIKYMFLLLFFTIKSNKNLS